MYLQEYNARVIQNILEYFCIFYAASKGRRRSNSSWQNSQAILYTYICDLVRVEFQYNLKNGVYCFCYNKLLQGAVWACGPFRRPSTSCDRAFGPFQRPEVVNYTTIEFTSLSTCFYTPNMLELSQNHHKVT